VILTGNPIYGEKTREENWPSVLKRISALETIDGKMVTPAIRRQADEAE